jgi:hypothetical protein
VPHIVSVEKLKYIGSNGRGRDIDVDDGCGMDLAVVGGPVKRQSPLYKWVRGVKVGADVTRRRFTAMLVSDVERDVRGASVVLKACWDG